LAVLSAAGTILHFVPIKACPSCGLEYREATETLERSKRADLPQDSKDYYFNRVRDWRCLLCGGRGRLSAWSLISRRIGPLPSER
jgi:hypothetical protein